MLATQNLGLQQSTLWYKANMDPYDLRSSINVERKILQFMGFYPERTERFKLFYKLRALVGLTFSYLQLLSMFAQIVVHRNDLSKLTDTLLFLMTHFTFLLKLHNFIHCRRKILKIEDQLGDAVFYGFAEAQLERSKKRIAGCIFVGKVFRAGCVIGVIFYALVPFVDASKKMTLPLPGWLPYDTTKYYVSTTVFQMICLCITANTNSTIDILTWIVISVCCAQLDILKENLKRIKFEKSDEAKEELKLCMVHYDKIMKVVSDIEQTFSRGIFLQFFASVIVICVTLFQTIFVPLLTLRFAFLISYLFCMMWQVSMYCWYGHDIMITSGEITKFVFMSNWYESEVKLRRILMIFMERLKRPVVLTAGNFIPLSLPTLISILRSSYSYFAVLQRVYKN